MYEAEDSDEEKGRAVAVGQVVSTTEIELLMKTLEEMGKAVTRLEQCQGQEVETGWPTNRWCYFCGWLRHFRC